MAKDPRTLPVALSAKPARGRNRSRPVKLDRVPVGLKGELRGKLTRRLPGEFPAVEKAGVYRGTSETLVIGEPVVRLYQSALDAFLSSSAALEWMQTEQGGLGGRRPVDMALDPKGLRLAEDELLRLVHGLLA
jgi:hypothetical protein